jgi:hypothetical protein
MPKRTKLTNSSDETDIATLISGDNIFAIPYFQRPYKWKADKLRQLNADILDIIDSSDSHFLGAVIIHGRRSNPADPNTYDIIDGQFDVSLKGDLQLSKKERKKSRNGHCRVGNTNALKLHATREGQNGTPHVL